MRRIIILIFLLTGFVICTVLFSGCKESVTGIMINKNKLTLVTGQTETLIATIQPDNAANKKVIWTSSNAEIATVTDKGLVIANAKNKGETTIIVTTDDGNKTATCLVTVVDYRQKWVGEYMGEYITSFTNPAWSRKDTIKDAVISVLIWDDSCLHFTGISTWKWKVKINTDGYFKQVDDNHGHEFYNGNICGDSLSLSGSTWSQSSSSSESYKGKKI